MHIYIYIGTDVTNKTLMSIQPDIPQYYNDLNLHTMYTNNTIYAFFRLLQVNVVVNSFCALLFLYVIVSV